MNYSEEILKTFSAPIHFYQEHDEIHMMGFAGDTAIGEYVHLYFKLQKSDNETDYANIKIAKAYFSVIGSVVLIAAAEKFCSLIEGLTFQEALKYCEPEKGLQYILSCPENKTYLINFVLQAFYKAFETLSVL